MGKYIDYLKYIIEHKINVFKICWKNKMYLHAFTHDLSKFTPIEFSNYVENFHGNRDCGKCKHHLNCNFNHIGLGSGNWAKECPDYKYKNFNDAWDHQVAVNKHHWEHWTYDVDMYMNEYITLSQCKLDKPRRIPDKYLDQMICDWSAMGIKFGNTAQEYYLNNYNKIVMEDDSRIRLEFKLGLNDSMIHNYGHTLKQFKEIYTEDVFNKYFGYINQKFGIDVYNKI